MNSSRASGLLAMNRNFEFVVHNWSPVALLWSYVSMYHPPFACLPSKIKTSHIF